MDAILTDKAEQLATEIATQAKTLDDLNGLEPYGRRTRQRPSYSSFSARAANREEPLFARKNHSDKSAQIALVL